jgi:peroxiredoxin
MDTLRRWFLCLAVVLPVVAAASAAGPDLVLKDMDGKDRNVNDYIGKGKWTVVAVWESTCTICNQEIHHMAFFHDAHRKTDATVLGVSIDGVARKRQAQAFIDDHSLDFPNLLADVGQIAKFGAGVFMGTPTYFIYSPQGELLAYQTGPVTQDQVEEFMANYAKKAKAASKQ